MATNIDIGDFDFGFSAVSESELKALERDLQEQVAQRESQLAATVDTYEEKLAALYKMVMPLLKNLAKDADKDYIFWPDRQKKMTAFIEQVESIVNG
jgi:ABC-type Zn2+ transport system substrate-binding protein/surface adhesin